MEGVFEVFLTHDFFEGNLPEMYAFLTQKAKRTVHYPCISGLLKVIVTELP